jgi:hypothetical protein
VRGCLFTLLLGAAAIALFVVVGLPAIAAGAITAGLTAGGLQSDDTTVTVSSDPPTDLLGMHADRVHVTASDATFRGLRIGSLDVTLGDLSLTDRSADSVDGRLRDVAVADVAGSPMTIDTIRLTGGGDRVTATATVPGDQVKAMVSDAIEQRLGTRPQSISLHAPDQLTVDLGTPVAGRLLVTDAGDLDVRISTPGPAKGTEVRVIAADALPIHLTDVAVTDGGDVRLSGELSVGLFGRRPDPQA